MDKWLEDTSKKKINGKYTHEEVLNNMGKSKLSSQLYTIAHPLKRLQLRKTANTKCYKSVEQLELLYIAGGNVNIKWNNHLRELFGYFLEN